MTTKHEGRVGPAAALLTFSLCAANLYWQWGWFGRYGSDAVFIASFVLVITYLIYVTNCGEVKVQGCGEAEEKDVLRDAPSHSSPVHESAGIRRGRDLAALPVDP